MSPRPLYPCTDIFGVGKKRYYWKYKTHFMGLCGSLQFSITKIFPLANYTIDEVQNIYVRSTVLSPETRFHIFTYQLRLKIEFWKEE